MFVKTFKTSRVELALIILGLIFFLATLWYVVSSGGRGKASGTSASPGGNPPAARFLVNARTAEDRLNFLSQFGWETEPDPIEVREVIIPAVFDEKLTEYNEIQKALGFDLEPYKGCRVKKWEYAVTNYPGGARNVKATLLIADGRVIGGDISAGGQERFVHSLLMPAQPSDESADTSTDGDGCD